MADEREDATVKMEGLQRVCCWVPAAMAESNLTNQQPICRNCQEQGIDETNRSEIGELAGEFLPGTQCQTTPASCSSKDVVHVTGGSGNRQAVEADNSGIVLDSSLNGLSFRNLLALIHNQGKIVVGDGPEHTGSVARSSSSAVCFHPVDEGNQLTEEFGNSPLQDQESGLEANRDAEPNMPKVFTDGGSILSKPCFDLNMPLWAITDAASCKTKSSQFEPETPLKNNKDEYRVPHRQYLSMEDEQHEMKESSVTSRQLQKYHKLGNGDEDQVDLIETHQQKPRRKKHGGGKQKCTPKKTTVKRKYVRKNRTQIPEDEVACIPPTNTRFLSFNLDAQGIGQSSLNCLSSSCNRVSQAENLNAEDPSKRTVQCGLEIVLMIDQKDAGIPHDQENMLAEKIDAESNLPNVFTDGSSIPSEPYFDLNLPPKTITNAALDKSKPSQFEPETPEKNTRNENWVPPRQHLNTEDVLAGKGRQEKKVTRNGLMELHETKEMSQQVLDQSVVFSGQLQENNKPDNRGKDQVDSIKTPQQNPSRKKHMPRVSIEGKQNATPESSEEKFNLQQKTTGVKRKYVRGREKEYQPVDEVYLVSSPQNKPRRKKHRPRVIKEGKQKGTPKKTTVKRKYARRNGTYEPEDGGPYMLRTRNSCRRFLNFNLDDQEKEQSSLYCLSSNCNRGSEAENLNTIDSSKRTVQCGQEIVLMMGKPDMGIAHESMHSMNQVQEVFMESPGQSPSSSTNMHLLENNSLVDELLSTRGKCQIVFSDVTHDKEIKSSSMSTNHNEQRTGKNLIDLICRSKYLAPERQNWKTQNMAITAQAENSNRNETATFGNSLENCLTLFSQIADGNSSSGLYFPAICKKRRSKRRRNMVTATMQHIASSTGSHAKLGQCITRYSSTTQCASMAHATDRNKEQNPVLEDILVLRPKERIKKKRSKGRKRLRDLSSLLEIHKMLPAFRGRAPTLRNGHGRRILREPSFMKTPALGTWRTTIRKKRSKRDVHINSTVVQYNQQKSSVIFMGLPLALTWKGSLSVDLITKQLNQLDLNAESTQELSQYPNALVKYHTRHEQHALVPFQKYGAVVPFDSSFDQDRRVWPRPKVDIDNETTRVWKLLLENINSEGIDGTDEENTTRWREERRVYSGRAESFIARMRLVQGDRRFTPWKGSVVDSVVGVFLTQNVSDHLSSSAFISLAARFPANTQIHPSDLQEEKLGIIIEEPEVYDIDPEGIFRLNKEILNQPVYSGQDTENIIQELSSVRSSGNSSSGFVSKDNLTEQSTESSKHNLVQSLETVATKTASFIEDGRDREDAYSSEKSADSPTAQTTEKSDSCVLSSTREEQTAGPESNRFTSSTSFVKLLQMAGTILVRDPNEKLSDQDWQGQSESESLATNLYTGDHLNNATFPSEPFTLRSESILRHAPNFGGPATQCNLSHEASKCFKSSSKKELHADEISELSSESALQARIEKIVHSSLEGSKFCSPNAESSNNDQAEIIQTGQVPAYGLLEENNSGMQMFKVATSPQHTAEIRSSNSKIGNSENSEQKDVNSNKNDPDYHHSHIINGQNAKKRGRTSIKKEKQVKWDNLRRQAYAGDRERVRTANTADSVDWDAVRCADVNEIAKTIKERGMNNMLAQRIKDFLNRLVRDHGRIDLEWLRDVPPDKAKEYLLSINGLGLKSVECVRLLTLHHVAFPVDTNVGRIAVRLGWVPLQPLPESLQLHLLELYPVLESIQKYLWPRLCKLDQGTLYELHYQLITFGKVFCSKSKPNCNACPMRGECKHFASAFASARLALPAPEEKGIMCTNEKRMLDHNPMTSTNTLRLPLLQANQMDAKSGAVQPIIEEPPSPEPIIEVPTTPESLYISDPTIEDAFSEEPDEIPTIQLNMEELTHNLQEIMQQNKELVEGDVSKALVALTSEAASIPVPKLKNMSRLRTEHQVYELPDSHPLLEGMDKREPDDPSPYLLAIWTPGETMDSIQPPERCCSSQGLEKLCTNETCPSCNSIREANSQTVRGTLLIPCRTAMRGSFPLNGTYFQVNEVFSDHESSLSPFIVPRAWLWNLPRRTVFFGTSIPTIFKGLSTEGIQYCFWRGFVCVRGFDRKIRAPRPLVARLHFPASKLGRRKGI